MKQDQPEFKKLQQAFSGCIRSVDPQVKMPGIENRRLNVYRELFFNNIESFISSTFPVLNEMISETNWTLLIKDFFATHKCESPYFLKISEEFLNYLESCELDFLPVFSYQLAHWEWMELYADVVETQDVSVEITDLTLTDIVTSNDCTWALAYDFPVHKASSSFSPVERESTFLIVHRDHDLSVGFIEINPLSMLLFDHIKQNISKPLNVLLAQIAADQGMDVGIITQGGFEIIQQWALLGLLKKLA